MTAPSERCGCAQAAGTESGDIDCGVAGPGIRGKPSRLGKQVFDLVELLGVTGHPVGQHSQRLVRLVGDLVVETACQGK